MALSCSWGLELLLKRKDSIITGQFQSQPTSFVSSALCIQPPLVVLTSAQALGGGYMTPPATSSVGAAQQEGGKKAWPGLYCIRAVSVDADLSHQLDEYPMGAATPDLSQGKACWRLVAKEQYNLHFPTPTLVHMAHVLRPFLYPR